MRFTTGRSARTYIDRLRRFSLLEDASLGELRAVARVAELVDVRARGVVADKAWRGRLLVGDGTLLVVSPHAISLAKRGACIAAGDVTVIAITDGAVVAIAQPEWNALRALAPGVVAALDAAVPSEALDDRFDARDGEHRAGRLVRDGVARRAEERGRVTERT